MVTMMNSLHGAPAWANYWIDNQKFYLHRTRETRAAHQIEKVSLECLENAIYEYRYCVLSDFPYSNGKWIFFNAKNVSLLKQLRKKL